MQRRPRSRGRRQTHVFPYSVPAGRRKDNPPHVGRTSERRSRFRRQNPRHRNEQAKQVASNDIQGVERHV